MGWILLAMVVVAAVTVLLQVALEALMEWGSVAPVQPGGPTYDRKPK